MKNDKPSDARLGDLFATEATGNAGNLDLSKVQMFFFSIVAIAAYGTALANALTKSGRFGEFPDI
jgi:hypothetical protein